MRFTIKSSASSQLARRQSFVRRSSRICGYSNRPGLPKNLVGAAATHAKETLTVRVVLVTADGRELAAFHLGQHSAKCWMAIHGTHGPDDFWSGHGISISGSLVRSYQRWGWVSRRCALGWTGAN